MPARRPIFVEGDPTGSVYTLVSGWAFNYVHLSDGRRQILSFSLPGDLIGGELTHCYTKGAETLTDATICGLSHETVRDLMHRFPAIDERLLWLLRRNDAIAREKMVMLGRMGGQARVAHVLVELAVRAVGRVELHTGEKISLPLTQPLIADACALTTAFVNRALRRLREDGIADFHAGRLHILEAGRFLALSGIERETLELWVEEAPASGGGERDFFMP